MFGTNSKIGYHNTVLNNFELWYFERILVSARYVAVQKCLQNSGNALEKFSCNLMVNRQIRKLISYGVL